LEGGGNFIAPNGKVLGAAPVIGGTGLELPEDVFPSEEDGAHAVEGITISHGECAYLLLLLLLLLLLGLEKGWFWSDCWHCGGDELECMDDDMYEALFGGEEEAFEELQDDFIVEASKVNHCPSA